MAVSARNVLEVRACVAPELFNEPVHQLAKCFSLILAGSSLIAR